MKRLPPRSLAVWFMLVTFGPLTAAYAQQTQPRQFAPARQQQESETEVRRERPAPNTLVVKPLPPELEAILVKWEQESAKIQSLRGGHSRHVYDHVFSLDKVATGRFYYESPDKGRIDLVGWPIPKGTTSDRKDKEGNAYKLQSDQPEKWICTGKEILTISESEKTFEVFPIPPEHQGQNIINGPLPFLFGMKAEQAKRRYNFQLIRNNERQVWLKAIPQLDDDLRNYEEATIILDKATYLPAAVRLIHPGRNQETVYVFDKVEKNAKGGILAWFKGEDNPFQPNLKGYRMVQPPAVSDGTAAPPNAITPASNTRPAITTPTSPRSAAQPRNAIKK